jgi:hypothetical protein
MKLATIYVNSELYVPPTLLYTGSNLEKAVVRIHFFVYTNMDV